MEENISLHVEKETNGKNLKITFVERDFNVPLDDNDLDNLTNYIVEVAQIGFDVIMGKDKTNGKDVIYE